MRTTSEKINVTLVDPVFKNTGIYIYKQHQDGSPKEDFPYKDPKGSSISS